MGLMDLCMWTPTLKTADTTVKAADPKKPSKQDIVNMKAYAFGQIWIYEGTLLKVLTLFAPENYYLFSVQNKASPSDNFLAKVASDGLVWKSIRQIYIETNSKTNSPGPKNDVRSDWFQNLFRTLLVFLSKINVFSGNYCDKWAVNAYGMLNV